MLKIGVNIFLIKVTLTSLNKQTYGMNDRPTAQQSNN